MNSSFQVYQNFKHCVVRITVELASGDLSSGTGFHIGDGHIVTARHVTEEHTIKEVVGHLGQLFEFESEKTKYPEDPMIDLAILKTNFDLSPLDRVGALPGPSHISIGNHDDASIDESLILSKVVVLGYPPIAQSSGAVLVAVSSEVNAIIDKYTGPHPHFILSAIPRGGFSGGPVLSEGGTLLGVVTEELFFNTSEWESKENGASESKMVMGFTSAISVEPLVKLIEVLD